MRMMFLIGCFTLLAGCQNKVDEPYSKTGNLREDSRYAGILAKCKAITIDTLQVYSSGEGMSADTFRYKGVPINSTDVKLFSPQSATEMVDGSTGMYACYTFAMDDSHTGIILRTLAMPDAASIKLFTLDKVNDTLTGFIELATFEGDGGESAEKTSWLYRNNGMKLNAYMWVKQTHGQLTKNENGTSVISNDHYYVLDLSKPKYDTINSNAGTLLKTFQAVVRN